MGDGERDDGVLVAVVVGTSGSSCFGRDDRGKVGDGVERRSVEGTDRDRGGVGRETSRVGTASAGVAGDVGQARDTSAVFGLFHRAIGNGKSVLVHPKLLWGRIREKQREPGSSSVLFLRRFDPQRLVARDSAVDGAEAASLLPFQVHRNRLSRSGGSQHTHTHFWFRRWMSDPRVGGGGQR